MSQYPVHVYITVGERNCMSHRMLLSVKRQPIIAGV